MSPGTINDLGYGICYECKTWKELTHFDPRSKGKPRKERKRCCSKCAYKISSLIRPFEMIKKAISGHKNSSGEGDYSLTDIMRLHSLQGGRCAYCAEPIPYSFSLEHIIPRKFGGKNLLFNILLVCPLCNSQKQHFELIYWLERKKYALAEPIYRKVRESYGRHEYEFKGTCKHCRGAAKANNIYCATKCSGAEAGLETRLPPQQIRRDQVGKIAVA